MAEAKFVIDGRDYPIPSIETFTMDEAMVLYEYSGLTLDQVGEMEGLHPGMVAALMHVGIARADPSVKPNAIRKVVKGSNLFEILEKMEAETEEDDAADPPVPATEPLPTSPAPEPSGDDSTSDGSNPPEAAPLRAIGSSA